jgi:hypothetical protein
VDLAVAFGDRPSAYWELVEDKAHRFLPVQYATIRKMKDRVWMLSRWEPAHITRDPRHILTYHRTLKEAKALGLVEVRFNLANKL